MRTAWIPESLPWKAPGLAAGCVNVQLYGATDGDWVICHPDEPMTCSAHPDTRPNLSCFLLFVEIGLVSPAGLELLEVRHQLAYLTFSVCFVLVFLHTYLNHSFHRTKPSSGLLVGAQ